MYIFCSANINEFPYFSLFNSEMNWRGSWN